jgi:hypothetical protein
MKGNFMHWQYPRFSPHTRVQAAVALLCTVMMTGCLPEDGLPPGSESGPGEVPEVKQDSLIYGNDDRLDVFEHPNATLRDRAQRSTVALMRASSLNTSNPNNVTFDTVTLGASKNLCATERFRDDPIPAFCSGTLIDDDLVLTAKSCFSEGRTCADTRFVFKFYRTSASTMETITTEDIFSCESIVTQADVYHTEGYAFVRLDRPATPRFTPAPVSIPGSTVATGQQIAVIGASAGTPFKIDLGGHVQETSTTGSYFMANTDTFAEGGAGSGVYETNGYTLIGVQSDGRVDDYWNTGTCQMAKICGAWSSCNNRNNDPNNDEDHFEGIVFVPKVIPNYCAAAESLRVCPTADYVRQFSWNPQRGWGLDGTIPLRLHRGSRPSAVIENGQTTVYGVGVDSYLRRARWVPGRGWKTERLPVPMGTDYEPAVVTIPEWNHVFVYSRKADISTCGGTGYCLQQAYWTPDTGWVSFTIPEVPIDGHLTVVKRPQWGQTLIYSGTKKDCWLFGYPWERCLQQASWTPGIGWEVFTIREVPMASDPTIDPEYGNIFSRANGSLQQASWSETVGWQVYSIGEVPQVGDPIFGGGRLYSRRSDKLLQESYWTDTGWRTNVIPEVTLKGEPAPLRIGDQVFIFDALL